MTSPPSSFLQQSRAIISAFTDWSRTYTPPAVADHVGYRCASAEEFEQLRALFEHESDFMYQSIISKRRIAIIKLKQGIETPLGTISFLELADQKLDGSQTSGFDHIEIYPVTGSVEDLVATFAASGVSFEETVRPHHTTYDLVVNESCKVRIEAEPLISKIKREEM